VNGSRNSISGKNALNECNSDDAIKAANEIKAFDKRVILTITHYRKRKCDTDAPLVKYLLDSIVSAGILKDDSTDEIKEIRHKFIKTKEEEKTVVQIRECDD